MEKTISVRRTTITFSIWDLGGQREFVNMLPLVCNDAVAILFMFDLSRKSTLNSVKEWYRQARGFNKVSMVFILALIQWSMSLVLFELNCMAIHTDLSCTDCDTFLDRNKVWYICNLPPRWTRRDYKAGPYPSMIHCRFLYWRIFVSGKAFCSRHARITHLLFNIRVH